MTPEELIPTKDFCTFHDIEYSFIDSLGNSGLINVKSVQQNTYIQADEMSKLEKFIRLHYDLDINIEGIETINYLLEKMEKLQKEIQSLRNRQQEIF